MYIYQAPILSTAGLQLKRSEEDDENRKKLWRRVCEAPAPHLYIGPPAPRRCHHLSPAITSSRGSMKAAWASSRNKCLLQGRGAQRTWRPRRGFVFLRSACHAIRNDVS